MGGFCPPYAEVVHQTADRAELQEQVCADYLGLVLVEVGEVLHRCYWVLLQVVLEEGGKCLLGL